MSNTYADSYSYSDDNTYSNSDASYAYSYSNSHGDTYSYTYRDGYFYANIYANSNTWGSFDSLRYISSIEYRCHGHRWRWRRTDRIYNRVGDSC